MEKKTSGIEKLPRILKDPFWTDIVFWAGIFCAIFWATLIWLVFWT